MVDVRSSHMSEKVRTRVVVPLVPVADHGDRFAYALDILLTGF